ncbi:MAG: uroporphyrinogen-III synthase [Bdellovibrionales bacterium]
MGAFVVITRPEPDASDYAKELLGLGYEVWVEPMLKIKTASFDVPDLSRYQGLLITSANALNAFLKGGGQVFDVPVFCVGKYSADAAIKAGFNDVIFVDGTGVDLFNYILAQKDVQAMSFLHLCGEHVAFDLQTSLLQAGIRTDSLVVYRSVQVDCFSDVFVELLRNEKISAVTFFSKRTADGFVRSVQNHFSKCESESVFSEIKALSISDSVLECVRVLPWCSMHAANAPNRDGILTLLRAYVQN